MTEKNYKYFKKTAWIFFMVMLIVSMTDLSLMVSQKLTEKNLPFKQENGIVTEIEDEALEEVLQNKVITRIDTFKFLPVESESTEDSDSNITIMRTKTFTGVTIDLSPDFDLANKDSVEIVLRDTLTNSIESRFVKTSNTLNKLGLLAILAGFAMFIFTFFNSFLLLKYSSAKENILIVFFLLCLMTPSPDFILGKLLQGIWEILISPFWGILFYHFVLIKAKSQKKVKNLYFISGGLFTAAFIAGMVFNFDNENIHIWSAFWMFKGFLLLGKEYKKSPSIELKRLWVAFGGIGASMISIITIVVVALLVTLIAGVSDLTGLSLLLKSYSQILGIITAIVILIPVLGIFLGFFWFLGSFSWSLLTGTALDVKIRSTLIYTIVGVFFVIVFGLVDYSLGELLQNIFGKFVGSEFVAGIPVTIGLIAFFNPVRNKVEKIVDNKLNTSELDFLEKTETFTHDLSEEGVLEGFEEYICENLIKILPIEKIALISFEKEIEDFKFNEVRGSDIIENSRVEDEHSYLLENKIRKNYGTLNENLQDISSFALLIPIIFESGHKWFLALGKKNDNSLYSKRDEQALIQLAERIKLSLKFILAYEDIVDKKYSQTIEEYERNSVEKDRIIEELRGILNNENEN